MTPTQLIVFVWLGTVAFIAGVVATGEVIRSLCGDGDGGGGASDE